MLTRDLKFRSTGNLDVAYGLITSHPRLCALVIAVIAMTTWQAAQAANLEPRTVGQITYLCGGVGRDEQQAMREQAGNFDRGFVSQTPPSY
jgi:hypothetical protein